MHNSHNKRQYNRINVNFPVRIELDDQQHAQGIAVNIGNGGMLINHISGSVLSKLEDVELHLPINHSQNDFIICAKITRVYNDQIGLFFYTDPSEFILKALD